MDRPNGSRTVLVRITYDTIGDVAGDVRPVRGRWAESCAHARARRGLSRLVMISARPWDKGHGITNSASTRPFGGFPPARARDFRDSLPMTDSVPVVASPLTAR